MLSSSSFGAGLGTGSASGHEVQSRAQRSLAQHWVPELRVIKPRLTIHGWCAVDERVVVVVVIGRAFTVSVGEDIASPNSAGANWFSISRSN